MKISPEHTIAIEQALTEMWQRQIARFSFVPKDNGFAVVLDKEVIFESNRCEYDRIEGHYIGNIKLYSPYWRTNPQELSNQKYQWAFRMMNPARFIDVFIQKGIKRIDFTFYVPLDFERM